MLHHISFTADDPYGVAATLAQLIGGRVSRFGPWPGGYIAWASDGAGTAIEVYPRGTEMSPDENGGQANFTHNYFAQTHTATHAAVSVNLSEAEVQAIAIEAQWRATTLDRGGFQVIEFWVENRVMLEVMTPAMLQQYLAVVNAPRIAASGTEFESLSLSVRVDTDCATAFRAWTDKDALQAWWPVPDARIDLRVGGPFELLFVADAQPGAQGSEGCKILSYIPDRMLSFTWNAPPHLAPALRQAHGWVVLTFTEMVDGTEIELTHNGFLTGPEWDECRTYFRQAWKRVLRRLEDHWQDGAKRTAISDAPTSAMSPAMVDLS